MDYTETIPHIELDDTAVEYEPAEFIAPPRAVEAVRPDRDLTREALDQWLDNRRLTRSESEFGIGFKAVTYAQIMSDKR